MRENLSAGKANEGKTGIKKAQSVIIAVLSFSFAGINLPAVNGLGHRAESPGHAALTVEFLLSLFAQLSLWDEPGHEHHLLSHGAGDYIILPGNPHVLSQHFDHQVIIVIASVGIFHPMGPGAVNRKAVFEIQPQCPMVF